MKRAWDEISYKSLYFVNRRLRVQNIRTFSQNQFCEVRSAGLIDIFVLNTWASDVSLSSLTISLHPHSRPFLLAHVRVHLRVYVCIIYGDTKDKFRDCLIWKQTIQAKKIYSRHKLVTFFTGKGERSIFKSCHRPTVRNVRGIVMCARYLIPYRSCGYLVYTPHV